MNRYISVETAIKTTWMILDGLGYRERENLELAKTVEGVFDTAPAANVVEVVRCLDCVYNRGETKDLWGNPAIKCVTAVTHEPDWYCASGKRKHGGQDE